MRLPNYHNSYIIIIEIEKKNMTYGIYQVSSELDV